ncbi:MAG: 1-acyl-sn-glycerol-3-phosphate acyltransferase [Bacteroidota bacterium]
MLIYQFGKHFAALCLRLIYRKIYYIDKDKLPPKKGATIFAVNHPTAFTDSFIFMVFSAYNCYFILRGDYFKVSPVIRWLMDQIRLIPIFRARDGFSAVKQNQDLFEDFYKIMHEGKDISIMVEGSHDHRKRLRKVQRGTARIVFGTYDKYGDTDMTIVPIGLTYSNVSKFRSTAAVKIGDPIDVADYIKLHKENARKALLKLTKDIQDGMQPLMVDVKKEEDVWLADQLLDMNRHDQRVSLFPPLSKNPKPLQEEIELVNELNELSELEKSALFDAIEVYQTRLEELNVTDLGVAKSKQIGFMYWLTVILGAPIFLAGAILGFLPYLIGKRVMKGVKKPEFIASMMLVGSMAGILIYAILLIIAGAIIGKAWFWLIVLAFPLLSYLALLYRDVFLDWRAVQHFRSLDAKTKNYLKTDRQSLLQDWRGF